MKEDSEGSAKPELSPLIAVLFFLLIFIGPIVGATSWKQSVVNDCNGSAGKEPVHVVTGTVGEFRAEYFIRGERRNWIVLSCRGKGGCPKLLRDRMHAALGSLATAHTCRGELLSVDINGERVIDRDVSQWPTWRLLATMIGVFLIVCIAYVMAERKRIREES